ncbi:hypothetical protein JOF28_001718 [Leucobacter exalbidus]|uniref:Uncharacterized protein n=1 Tax=Leucobacter exalbidus TaxID=662960 RepID=A0A940PYI6_9MICO|nr:hypothetical protein [Leucobacter exalbidus]MBP1326486.1 hypothetical protein [Leucobacter exalbidus]
MPSQYDAALQLDIPLEMARRHGIPSNISQADLNEIDQNPPAWLAQSRANRTGKKKVWATLQCAICSYSEQARPKKWWPEFTLLACYDHEAHELPKPFSAATTRTFVYGVGSRFTGVIDADESAEGESAEAPEA